VLGNNTGDSTTTSGGSTLFTSRFDLVQPATILRLHVWVASGSGMIITGIYSDNAGQPESLVTFSMPQDSVIGWNTVDIVTHLPAGHYWLAVEAQFGVALYYTDTSMTTGEGSVRVGNTFGTMPDPFGSGTAQADRVWSIYADFCPDIGYLVTATGTPTITETYTVSPTSTVTPTAMPPGIPTPDDQAYVYPMPAFGNNVHFVFILSQPAVEVTIDIFDFAGNLVREEKEPGTFTVGANSSLPVDLRRLRTGIYFYLIKTRTVSGDGDKIPVKKFIVKQ